MKFAPVFLTLLFIISTLSQTPLAQAQKKETAKDEKLKVGDKAPDFELSGIGDKKIKLSDRFGKNGKNVVVLFSRASW